MAEEIDVTINGESYTVDVWHDRTQINVRWTYEPSDTGTKTFHFTNTDDGVELKDVKQRRKPLRSDLSAPDAITQAAREYIRRYNVPIQKQDRRVTDDD